MSPEDPGRPARPAGPLLWFHASTAMQFAALSDLAQRIGMARPDVQVVASYDAQSMPDPTPEAAAFALHCHAVQADLAAHAEAFLDHWQPDLCLWAGGRLISQYTRAAARRGMAMILADVSAGDFQGSRIRWLPSFTRSGLDQFDTILVTSRAAQQAVARLGIAPAKVSQTEPMRPGVSPPPCNDGDLADLTTDLAARPVWLSARTHPDEIDAVIAAHRAALRLSHRLLLILHLDQASCRDGLCARLASHRLRFADWDNGDPVEDPVQILISTDEADLGLWYRLAPIAFLGGSVVPDGGGISPLDAAALGSAVLFGPHVGSHADTYARLAAAGAARTVTGGEALGAALLTLIAPDHAATMALSGWQIATEGAELTDRLVDMVQDRLDQLEAAHEAT
ncbi:MAG: glycosyltransferase N-terminal domain-containing protein [Pseudomonadota bacterium]|nr:glycosyltransferase N-terminal domain-containing protein [Pseudomonadota bacterium]